MTGPSHGHLTTAGSPSATHRGRLAAVLAILVVALVAELVGGLVSGSLALLADAGHLLTDAVAVTVALVAVTVAQRPAPEQRSYGNYRVEILAALVNGVLLLLVCAVVAVEGVRRLADPGTVDAGPMFVVGLVGFAAAGSAYLLLRDGQAHSLNVRGAYLEVLGDLLGAAAVVVAAVVIATTGWVRVDPVASLLIAALILPRAVALLRAALHVLVEGTPADVDLQELREHLTAVPGVLEVHDLHVWTITSGMPVLSAHVVVADEPALAACGSDGVLDRLTACVGDHFDVAHSTFQIEPAGHARHEHAAHG
jgi:cobalt-zinc-cadmium efflux system protein